MNGSEVERLQRENEQLRTERDALLASKCDTDERLTPAAGVLPQPPQPAVCMECGGTGTVLVQFHGFVQEYNCGSCPGDGVKRDGENR